jgi:hypothetical protein
VIQSKRASPGQGGALEKKLVEPKSYSGCPPTLAVNVTSANEASSFNVGCTKGFFSIAL